MPAAPPIETRELTDQEKTLRKAMWVPCRTKEALARWVRIYLGVDLPDGHVDKLSNSSPLECLWEIYEKALLNDDPNFNRVLAYASRISFKTLIAAIMEVLCLVHLDRDVVHLASIKDQSAKAQEYVKLFFGRPYLRDFLVGDASTYTEIYFYVHRTTGEILNRKEFRELAEALKLDFEEQRRYIDITTCTMAGTNSKHAAFMVVDEVDVIEGEKVRAYAQAKLIPDRQRGKYPITFLISTRKTSVGKVQQEIDDAPKTKLIIRHWNVLDVTEPCPDSRSRPDLPHVILYRNEKLLRVLTQAEYDLLEEPQRIGFEPHEAFHGCQHNCELFGPCEGRLATINTNRTGALKSLPEITTQFRSVSADMAIAELLSRKASSEGVIYPSLDEGTHLLTAAQMASIITGEHVSEPFDQNMLIHLCISRDMRPVAGVDFGFSHNFSLICGFTDGNRLFLLRATSMPELMPDVQLELALKHCKPLKDPEVPNDFLYSARIFPDIENSQMIAVFKKGGLNCVKWKKGPGSVLAGIEAVRMALSPVVGRPRLFFMRGDPYVELFFNRMTKYHWKLGADGKPSDIPEETLDDECDAARYVIMNILGKNSGLVVARDEVAEEGAQVKAMNLHRQLTGMPGAPAPTPEEQVSEAAKAWRKGTAPQGNRGQAPKTQVFNPEKERQMNWNAIAAQVGMPTLDQPSKPSAAQGGIAGDARQGRKGSISWDI